MALQICSFKADYSLSGIPANRIFAPVQNTSTRFIFPLNKNVLIKKISLNCIYNAQGEIAILDYGLCLNLRQFNNQLISIDNPIFINGVGSVALNPYSIFLNKKNSFINTKIIAGELIINSAGTGSLINLSSSGIIGSNISFLISIYYENINI
jgi:hypothetical protein